MKKYLPVLIVLALLIVVGLVLHVEFFWNDTFLASNGLGSRGACQAYGINMQRINYKIIFSSDCPSQKQINAF